MCWMSAIAFDRESGPREEGIEMLLTFVFGMAARIM